MRSELGRILAVGRLVGPRFSLFPAMMVAAVLLLGTSEAHAHGYGIGGQLWFEATGTYMPNNMAGSPTLDVSAVSSNARQQNITGSTPAFGFATGFFGVRTGLDFVTSDRWIFPVIDVGFYGAVGMYPDVLTSADGTFFRLHPAGMMMFDAEFLGFGVRFKRRRWMFEATIKPGVALLAVPAAVSNGPGWTDIDALNGASPTLRASLSLCRRLDPMERICASITPNIYQWGWGNGGSVSLRWELGS
jgi:hypothetical protein